MLLGIDPKVDFAFKRMLGSPEHPAITIHFLNSVLQLPDPVTEVEVLDPIQGKDHFEDKLAVLDILARDRHGRRFNIEMQTTVPEALCQRLLYYNCCNYTEQLSEGDGYEDLRPAISICVLDKVLFPTPTPYHLSFRLHCDQADLVFSHDLQFHTLELPKFSAPGNNVNSSPPIDQWAFLLKHAPELETTKLSNLFSEAPLQEALGVLQMIAKSPDERWLYQMRLKAQRDARAQHNAAIKEGLQQGLEQGIEKGREQGVEQGILIGQIQMLLRFLGDAPASEEELLAKSLPELTAMVADLQSRFETRQK